jgi:hypothetical protein
VTDPDVLALDRLDAALDALIGGVRAAFDGGHSTTTVDIGELVLRLADRLATRPDGAIDDDYATAAVVLLFATAVQRLVHVCE